MDVWEDRVGAADPVVSGLVVERIEATGPDPKAWIVVTTPAFEAKIGTESGIVTSLRDNRSGRQLVPLGDVDHRPELGIGVLQLLDERPHDMSAWEHCDVHTEQSLLRGATTTIVEEGPLVVVIEVVHEVRSSRMVERLTFHRDVPRIDIALDVDWQEPGGSGVGVPNLKLSCNVSTRRPQAWFEAPFAAVERAPDGSEVPALRWAAICGENGGLAILNDGTYGHDALGSRLRATVVRTAYDPDPRSDRGARQARFVVVPLVQDWREEGVTRLAAAHNEPMLVRAVERGGAGASPLGRFQPVVAPGAVLLSGCRVAATGRGRILRLWESTGRAGSAVISAGRALSRGRSTRATSRFAGSPSQEARCASPSARGRRAPCWSCHEE